ncbi:hypothetical protein [Nocardioides rubriscoriae]|uniref:hypothetical protein n=1 Tax=Nocardioides rubriscoriae TaxID=642762 RepID=UPI0011DF7A96|nr:hypothetical protein [Nocardioides rubriscoriae]
MTSFVTGCDSQDEATTACDEFSYPTSSSESLRVDPSDVGPGDTFVLSVRDSTTGPLDGFLVSTDPAQCRVLYLNTDAGGDPAGWEDVTDGLPAPHPKPMYGPPGVAPTIRLQVPNGVVPGEYLVCGATSACTALTVE